MNPVSAAPKAVAKEEAAAAARQRRRQHQKRLLRVLDVIMMIMATISLAFTQAYAVVNDQLQTGSYVVGTVASGSSIVFGLVCFAVDNSDKELPPALEFFVGFGLTLLSAASLALAVTSFDIVASPKLAKGGIGLDATLLFLDLVFVWWRVENEEEPPEPEVRQPKAYYLLAPMLLPFLLVLAGVPLQPAGAGAGPAAADDDEPGRISGPRAKVHASEEV